MKPWALVVAVVAGVALGSLGTLPFRADDTADTEPSRRASTTNDSPDAGPSPGSSPTPSATSIETSATSYVGEAFETIAIPGTYHGPDEPRQLRVQLERDSGWTSFPLPVVTEPSGEFRAYVELGPGRHRLRVVDPEAGVTSRPIRVLIRSGQT